MYDQAAAEMSKEEMDKHVASYPLGVGIPEDVAQAAIFTLSCIPMDYRNKHYFGRRIFTRRIIYDASITFNYCARLQQLSNA